jgi:hypothetical protein
VIHQSPSPASPASANATQQNMPPGLHPGLQLQVFCGPSTAQACGPLGKTHCPPAAVQSWGVPYDFDGEDEVQAKHMRPRSIARTSFIRTILDEPGTAPEQRMA